MNTVAYLQEHDFRTLPYADKVRIKALGRATPELRLESASSSRTKVYMRQFKRSVYDGFQWLCGCEERNAFFCFPCLLYGGDKLWTVTGYADLAHLSRYLKRHEVTKQHIANEVGLALLGNENIKSGVDPLDWVQVKGHNDQVDRNRYVLSRIVDCIKFCGSSELTLLRENGGPNSGLFPGLVDFSASLDDALRQHLGLFATFKATSKDVQELLQCALEVCREKIANEVNEANYVTVMGDDSSDVASTSQMSLVLRYVKGGVPVERFWGFISPMRHDADCLAACVQHFLDPLLADNPKKLIAQTYDGGSVTGSSGDVHKVIKKTYPFANLVHCHAHRINSIIYQAISKKTQVRAFFSKVDHVASFFSLCPRAKAVLGEVAGAEAISWTTKSQTVSSIYGLRALLARCARGIQEESRSSDDLINRAIAVERFLTDDDFLFWLNIFYYILPHVDVLSDDLQKRGSDIFHVKRAVGIFEAHVDNVRKKIDGIIQMGELLAGNHSEPLPKRPRVSRETLRATALEACDIMVNATKCRFENITHLKAATLASSSSFKKFSRTFPNGMLKEVAAAYPNVDSERLKTELEIVYKRLDFKQIGGTVQFLKMLRALDLGETFKETIKLIEIIMTIPMATAEPERCLPTLAKMRSFAKNSAGQERLSALAMLSFCSELVTKDHGFNSKVIEKFANGAQIREELIYKK